MKTVIVFVALLCLVSGGKAHVCYEDSSVGGAVKVISQGDLTTFKNTYRSGQFGCQDCSTGVYIVGVQNDEEGQRLAVIVDKRTGRRGRPNGLIRRLTQVFIEGVGLDEIRPIRLQGMNWENRQDYIGQASVLGGEVGEVIMSGWGGIDAFSVGFEGNSSTGALPFHLAAFRFNHLPQGFDVKVLLDGGNGDQSGEDRFATVNPEEFILKSC